MSHAGIIDSMHALLEDYTATTVGLREGKRQLHDGPYADTDEQISGYFVIEVANLDRALEWGALSGCGFRSCRGSPRHSGIRAQLRPKLVVA